MSYFNSEWRTALAGLLLVTGCGFSSETGSHNAPRQQTTTKQKEKAGMKEISGQFDVEISPTESDDPQLGMMILNKTYRGSLDAKGAGRMLTGMTDVKGSAGYVAIEKVTGSLDGAKGSFIIQHFGVQQGEAKRLNIEIIPDSGTEELAGIEGNMQIDITDEGHMYRLFYRLPRD